MAAALLALAVPGLAAARTAPATDLSLSPADGLSLATSAAELSHDVLVGRNLVLARRAARLGGPRVTHHVRRRLTRLDFHGLAHERHALSRQLGVLRGQARTVAKVRGTLAMIRACESGGKYTTNTGNGFYGAYQFDRGTWQSMGGHGVASDAPPLEQDARAAALLARSGSSPWPVCGH